LARSTNALIAGIVAFATRLRFPTLFVVTAALFVFDLLVPDAIPLVDELLLALGTVLFASWKRRSDEPPDEADAD